jgi:hypothetical protein
MGTNFYWNYTNPERKPEDEEEIQHHIGKRSAAGPYCYECGTTLCSRGSDQVHMGRDMTNWLDECPSCGAKSSHRIPHEEIPPNHPVRNCCSFTWTLFKHEKDLRKLAEIEAVLTTGLKFNTEAVYADFVAREIDLVHPVVNEYGVPFTATAFLQEELKTVKIVFQSPYKFF